MVYKCRNNLKYLYVYLLKIWSFGTMYKPLFLPSEVTFKHIDLPPQELDVQDINSPHCA